MSMPISKIFIRRGAKGRRGVEWCYSSAFRYSFKVVIVVEHLVAGDRDFQTAGAIMLNVLDWKEVGG